MPNSPSPPIFPSCAALRIPASLSNEANRLGYAAIGIADRNSLAGVVRAYDAWKKLEPGTPPRLLVGARLVFRDGTPDILAYPQRSQRLWPALPADVAWQIARAKRRMFSGSGRSAGVSRRPAANRHAVSESENARPLLSKLGPDIWLAASMLYAGEDRRRLQRLCKSSHGKRGVPLIAVNDVLYHSIPSSANCRTWSPASASM